MPKLFHRKLLNSHPHDKKTGTLFSQFIWKGGRGGCMFVGVNLKKQITYEKTSTLLFFTHIIHNIL